MKTLIIVLSLFSLKCYAPSMDEEMIDKMIMEIKKEDLIKSFNTKELNLENLIAYVKLYDSVNYEVIVKQAILETGWFKSRLARQYNNIFGMMHSKRKNAIDNGVAYTYSVTYGDKVITYHPSKYTHWTDSVKDYFLWRDYKVKRHNLRITNYYTFLSDIGYAVEGNYCKVLKKIKI